MLVHAEQKKVFDSLNCLEQFIMKILFRKQRCGGCDFECIFDAMKIDASFSKDKKNNKLIIDGLLNNMIGKGYIVWDPKLKAYFLTKRKYDENIVQFDTNGLFEEGIKLIMLSIVKAFNSINKIEVNIDEIYKIFIKKYDYKDDAKHDIFWGVVREMLTKGYLSRVDMENSTYKLNVSCMPEIDDNA